MRILLLNNLWPPDQVGGYEILAHNFRRTANEQIQVLTTEGPTAEPGVHRRLKLEEARDMYRRLERSPEDLKRAQQHNFTALREVVAAFRPEVLLVFNLEHFSPFTLSHLGKFGVPVVHWIGSDWLSKILQRADRTPPLTHVTVCSRFSERQLGIPCTLVYPGVDTSTLASISPQQEQPRVLYVGQIAPHKGVDILIRAARRVPVEVTLVGGGPGKYQDRLLKDLPPNVTWLGRRPNRELPEIFARHNIFAFTTLADEPLGTVHLEGRAAGLALITTLTGGTSESVTPGVDALTVRPGDDRALAEAIRKLSDDSTLRRKVAESGRRTVQERFDIRQMTEELSAKCSLACPPPPVSSNLPDEIRTLAESLASNGPLLLSARSLERMPISKIQQLLADHRHVLFTVHTSDRWDAFESSHSEDWWREQLTAWGFLRRVDWENQVRDVASTETLFDAPLFFYSMDAGPIEHHPPKVQVLAFTSLSPGLILLRAVTSSSKGTLFTVYEDVLVDLKRGTLFSFAPSNPPLDSLAPILTHLPIRRTAHWIRKFAIAVGRGIRAAVLPRTPSGWTRQYRERAGKAVRRSTWTVLDLRESASGRRRP